MNRLPRSKAREVLSTVLGPALRGLAGGHLRVAMVAPFLRSSGTLQIDVGGVMLPLDMRFPHERKYAARHILRLRYPQADIDRLLFARFARPGDTVLDAGANIGLTALEALAAGCARVCCFEPIAELARRIESLHDPRIEVREKALSDRVGQVDVTMSAEHNQGSTYHAGTVRMFKGVFGANPETRSVACTTLDAENLPPFDIWKIDVEGVELDLLAGAQGTLRRAPPRAIFVESRAPMFAEFRERIRGTHPHCYRALIARRGYALTLVDPATRIRTSRYFTTSPTYVFLKSALD